ncbi:MAG: ATP phosphoribosyltransferase [Limnochordales bacterium]|nr:ATP phosphoribosyltransferase [Limnochordales bacterium]
MLTIAVPKGRVLTAAVELFREAGLTALPGEELEESRRLVIEDEEAGLRLLLAKPWDVPTYVEYGAADLGLAGKDVLLERGKAVAELLDLGIGRCRMICAVPADSNITNLADARLLFPFRVATKYPQIAATFLERQGIAAEIINLHGSVELAPLVGLADGIIDLTETGRTLQENGLRIVADILSVTTRLVANAVLHKVKQDEIDQLVNRLEKAVAARVATQS